MQKLPGVRDIEHFMIGDLFTFGEPYQGPDGIEAGTGGFPEVERHEHRHIAAEAVDPAGIHPKLHALHHGFP